MHHSAARHLATGIRLGTTTGVITVPPPSGGSYSGLEFSVCDKISDNLRRCLCDRVGYPSHHGGVGVYYMTGDIEFDWRATPLLLHCNLDPPTPGELDRSRQQSLGELRQSGDGSFTPNSGRETNVAPGAPSSGRTGQWTGMGLSTPVAGQNPVSQLVYTAFGGRAATTNMPAPLWPGRREQRRQRDVGFTSSQAPITAQAEHGAALASQCVSDTFASAVFENLLTPTQMFTEPLSTAAGTQPFETPFGALANGIGERFVACAHDAIALIAEHRWLTFQGDVTIGTMSCSRILVRHGHRGRSAAHLRSHHKQRG